MLRHFENKTDCIVLRVFYHRAMPKYLKKLNVVMPRGSVYAYMYLRPYVRSSVRDEVYREQAASA